MHLSVENLKKLLSKSSSLGEQVIEFNENDSIVEQGVDSLDMLDFFLSLEENFGIQIPDKDIDQLKSLSDILNYLHKRLNA